MRVKYYLDDRYPQIIHLQISSILLLYI